MFLTLHHVIYVFTDRGNLLDYIWWNCSSSIKLLCRRRQQKK